MVLKIFERTLLIQGEMGMKKQLSGIVAASLIISAATAFGANREEQFSISPVIGGYTFEGGKQHLNTNLVYGARAGYNFTKAIGVEALFDYVYTKSYTTPSQGKADLYRYGGDLLYHFMPDNNFVPYIAAGFSGVNFYGANINRKTHGAFDYGAGFKYFLTDSFALRADVRHIIYSYNSATVNSTTVNNLEYTVGAYIPFGAATPAAKVVAQPVMPAPAPEPVKVVAPPPAPLANLTIAPISIVKINDAAATLSWTSSNADKCTIQPEIGPVETQGSRSISPSHDTAYTLTCTGLGGEATSKANISVTIPPPPPVLAPAPAPAPAPVVESAQKLSAAQRFCNKPSVLEVQFDTNKTDIKPKYKADFDKLAEFLKDFPNSKGEISGHTDNVGSKKFNDKLSQRRADSVKKYMEKNYGIAPERITAKGFGFSKPVASNKTKAGKAKNRRIEANFICE